MKRFVIEDLDSVVCVAERKGKGSRSSERDSGRVCSVGNFQERGTYLKRGE